jgi:hypothetical protein
MANDCTWDRNIAADLIPARVVFITSKLDTMSRFGSQQDCLRSELSWLRKRYDEVISAETSVWQKQTLVGYKRSERENLV